MQDKTNNPDFMFLKCTTARQKEVPTPAEDALVQWRAQNVCGAGMAGGTREWQELGFPQPHGFTTLSQVWTVELQSINAEAGQGKWHSLQLPNSRQLEPRAPLAPWWVPRQRCSSKEQPATGVERGGVLLYGSMVNQLHFLFPLLNIIMLSAWLL